MKLILEEIDLIVEGIEDVRPRYPKIEDKVFDEIIRLDPTTNIERDRVGNYSKWLLTLYNRDNLKEEDFYKVNDYLKQFDLNKRHMKNKDIFQFKSLGELAQALDEVKPELSDRQELRQTQKKVRNVDLGEDAELFAETKDYEIWVPKTYEASCKLGQGTQWCTATTSDRSYYDQYSKKGPLYIFINKNTGKPEYQYHKETDSFMDKYDIEVGIFEILGPEELKSFGYEEKDNFIIKDKIIYSYKGKESKIKIPDGIEKIGDTAFKTVGITEVTFPDTLIGIGRRAFENNFITELIIPDSVKEILSYAFYSNGIKNIKLPRNIKHIDRYVFSDNFIEEITLPDTVELIDYGAFSSNNINKLNIGKNSKLGRISSYAFSENELIEVELPVNSTWNISSFDEEVRILFKNREIVPSKKVKVSKGLKVIYLGMFQDSEITDIEIPEGVEEIGDYAFANNYIKEVRLPETLKEIESSAFAHNLIEKLVIPPKIKKIWHKSFMDNRIEKLDIGKNVEDIHYYAFANNKLKEITIPSNVKYIGPKAFINNEIEEVSLPKGIKVFEDSFDTNVEITYYDINESKERRNMKLILEEVEQVKWTEEQLADLTNYLKDNLKDNKRSKLEINHKGTYNKTDKDQIEIHVKVDADLSPLSDSDDHRLNDLPYTINFTKEGELQPQNADEEWVMHGWEGFEPTDDREDILNKIKQLRKEIEYIWLEHKADADEWDERVEQDRRDAQSDRDDYYRNIGFSK